MTDWIENAIPLENNKPSKCYYYDHIDDFNKNASICDVNSFNRTNIVRCNEFVYQTDEINLVNEVINNNIKCIL